MLAPEGEGRQAEGTVVLGVSDRTYGRFFTGAVESGGIRIRERGDSTVVFVAGGGFVEGALAEAGDEVTEELVGISSGLAAAGRWTRAIPRFSA